MTSITPLALKRKANSRLAASNPRVKTMEQNAHDLSIETYSSEIFRHLSELEKQTKITPELILSQPQINVGMRPILFDFLVDVHSRLKLTNTTLFLTINIIDRYCSLRIVRKDHFQLLGLTALWLASKYSDSKHKVPSLDFLRATCCNCYSKNLFVEMETHILKSLNWEVGSPSHDAFIDLMLSEKLKIDHNKNHETINSIKYGANFICQLVQFYTKVTFNYTISQIAIASVSIMSCSLALITDNNFIHYSSTTNSNLKLTRLIEEILNIIKNNEPPLSLKTKFYHKVDDIRTNPTLNSIYQYAVEISHLSTLSSSSGNYPQTPISSTFSSPIASRSSSTSSNNSDSPMMMMMMTPPTSCTASPIDNVDQTYIETKKSHNNINYSKTLQIPQRSNTVVVPLQELKIRAPSSFKYNNHSSKTEDIEIDTTKKRPLEV